jgi:flagellar hook-associated protein 1
LLTESFKEDRMLPSSLSSEILTQGLYIQQLSEDTTASNIANSYLDSDGYLMNSIEQVYSTEGAPYNIGSPNGNLMVESGPVVQTITRLRSSFLDAQIQAESTIVGQSEILNGILPQINGIINGSSGTLNSALDNFAAAWTALAANPTSIALRSTVVNDGVAFATLARNQYDQLQTIQQGLNGQVQQTVGQVNELLQQLASLNQQLNTTGGAGINANPLLDARDYALDKLSRLINIQVNYGSNGTVIVYLGNSSLDLVDPAGASILQTNGTDPNNLGLSDVTLQDSEGTMFGDVTNWITGGNLGGELQSRDVVVQSYMTQVDQIATSVIDDTNIFESAGYAANGITTGTDFFTGTGAQDINVNASITDDPTSALLATAIDPNDPTDGTIAQFIGNLPNLLANNYIESIPAVGVGINPANPIGGQAFATAPVSGSFVINGITINYTTGDSVDQILNLINTQDPNVQAVFNATTQQFYILSSNPITITNGATGNFLQWANINNVLTSTIRMAQGFQPGDPNIILGQAPAILNAALNSLPVNNLPPADAANSLGNAAAFRVTPSTSGSFAIDGVVVPILYNGVLGTTWYDTQSLNYILNQIRAASAAGAFPGTKIGAAFSTQNQTLTLFSTGNPLPITITDLTGNFTVFTGLNGNTPIGNLSSGILTQISSAVSAQQSVQDQASASLTQLNNAQANIGAVATTAGQPGVPIATIQQQAMQEMISYNASVQVMEIMDQMYMDLIGIVGGSTTNSTVSLTQQSSS